jgi:hypothetical protein
LTFGNERNPGVNPPDKKGTLRGYETWSDSLWCCGHHDHEQILKVSLGVGVEYRSTTKSDDSGGEKRLGNGFAFPLAKLCFSCRGKNVRNRAMFHYNALVRINEFNTESIGNAPPET